MDAVLWRRPKLSGNEERRERRNKLKRMVVCILSWQGLNSSWPTFTFFLWNFPREACISVELSVHVVGNLVFTVQSYRICRHAAKEQDLIHDHKSVVELYTFSRPLERKLGSKQRAVFLRFTLFSNCQHSMNCTVTPLIPFIAVTTRATSLCQHESLAAQSNRRYMK